MHHCLIGPRAPRQVLNTPSTQKHFLPCSPDASLFPQPFRSPLLCRICTEQFFSSYFEHHVLDRLSTCLVYTLDNLYPSPHPSVRCLWTAGPSLGTGTSKSNAATPLPPSASGTPLLSDRLQPSYSCLNPQLGISLDSPLFLHPYVTSATSDYGFCLRNHWLFLSSPRVRSQSLRPGVTDPPHFTQRSLPGLSQLPPQVHPHLQSFLPSAVGAPFYESEFLLNTGHHLPITLRTKALPLKPGIQDSS